jgi:hypothetical protein
LGHAASTPLVFGLATVKRDSTLAARTRFVIFDPMKPLAALFAFGLSALSLSAASPLLTLDNVQLPSPAGVGASAAQFIVAGGGHILLSWIEPGPDNFPALYTAQFDSKTLAWGKPTLIGPTSAIPVPAQTSTGPVAVSNDGRLATVWFVADKKDPRILLSVSPDAGAHFLMPQRIEDTRPVGAPAVVLLSDGTVFASWLEHYNKDETAIWLRRISPGGDLSVPVLLATLPTDHAVPRLVLLKDYDATAAQLLLTYTLGEADSSQIVTRLLTIPFPGTTPTANPCNCPTDDETARGYALKGRVVALSQERGTLTVQHDDIPGVLKAATTEFKTDPSVLKLAATSNEVFARIELRGSEWWLFSARLIARP